MSGRTDGRPDVVQEDDRMDARKAWLWTGGAFAATVLLCLAAWLVLRTLDGPAQPARDVPETVGAPPPAPAAVSPDVPGEPFPGPEARPATAATDTGPAWAWIDRDARIARVPVEAAMELLVALEGGTEAGDAVDTAGQPEPTTGAGRAEVGDTTDGPGGDGGGDPPGAAVGPHPVLSAVDVEPRPGARLPLEVPFTDADGATAPLGAAFAGERPVLVVPGWYRCRMLCGTVLDRLANAVAGLEGLQAGRDFEVVALGIDPREGPADARARRERVRARLRGVVPDGPSPGDRALTGWRFLTGAEGAARRVADSLGFRYAWDPSTDQYAHAAAVFAVSPSGTLSAALHGVDFEPTELERAIARAAAGRPGLSLEGVLVRCFRYTPALQRHAGLIANLLRGGGVAIVLGLAGVFVLAARRASRGARPGAAT